MTDAKKAGKAPQYPLTVDWGNGESEEFVDQDHLECNLEWLDTELEKNIKIYDRSGRQVRLKVVALQLEELEILDQQEEVPDAS